MTRAFAVILIVVTIPSLAALLATAQSPSPASAARSPARSSDHWAYQPPRRPELPEPRNRVWPRHPLDRFLLVGHERHDLVAMPPADRQALARRLSLTLTQLPPAPEWLEEFAADDRPDAYERLVDRLLASPHFGERMAQPWLDLAHYADTHGYHADTHRDMWRWRDWVVESFNHGMPYDEFLTAQLAGDLPLAGESGSDRDSASESRSLDRRIATGLLRNHMIIFENGVIDEEYRVEYVMDRVTTFGAVALGQTLQCARCHDHKHDPFTRDDFYRLFAYFNNVPEKGVDGEHGNAVPFIVAPTRLQQEALSQIERRIARLRQTIDERLKQIDPEQAAWERNARPERAVPPTDPWLYLPFDEPADQPVLNAAQPDAAPPLHSGSPARVASPGGQALLFDGETSVAVAPLIHEQSDRGWTCVATVFPTLDERLTIVSRTREIPARRGWSLTLEDRRPTLRAIVSTNANDATKQDDESASVGPIVAQADVQLPLRQWRQVAVAIPAQAGRDDKSPAAVSSNTKDILWYVNGQPVASRNDTNVMTTSLPNVRESLEVRGVLRVGRTDEQFGFRGAIDAFWMFDRRLSAVELQTLGGVDPLVEWLAVPASRRTVEQSRAIRERFLREHDPAFQKQVAQLRADETTLAQLRRSLPTTMVMAELPEPRATHVLERGRYDAPGVRVTADVPRWLTPTLRDPAPRRDDLARWLFRRDHPLTSRVAVNRLWQMVFGRGLVATPDDFGTHGTPPSHPELLDWLAIEFQGTPDNRSAQWDMKRFVRSLVTSATFRQSSTAPHEFRELDPDNVWLARGPGGRLAAEAIRDQALAVSGLLDRRIGGPGVFPYQPPGLWEELAYDAQQFTAQKYRLSKGGDLYRRSLYTFWKRAAPPPSLALFDAPDRETCAARRFSSDTPQQALVLMNDPTFQDAARELAANSSTTNSSNPDAMLERMFVRVLARRPAREELATLRRAYDEELAQPASADGTPSERRALAFVAHLILSLDETVNSP